MRNGFVEISDGFYLDANNIKIVVDYSRKMNKFLALIRRCKNNDKLRNKELDKRKVLAEKGIVDDTFISYRRRFFAHANKTEDGTYRYIVTRNNELHQTALSFEEVKRRCFDAGVKLVDMSELSCIALSYIDGIDNVSSDSVSSSHRVWLTEMANLQFVSGSVTRTNTILWLKTNEIVKLSKDTQEIVEQIQRLKTD